MSKVSESIDWDFSDEDRVRFSFPGAEVMVSLEDIKQIKELGEIREYKLREDWWSDKFTGGVMTIDQVDAQEILDAWAENYPGK
jgi:hypothetical protein